MAKAKKDDQATDTAVNQQIPADLGAADETVMNSLQAYDPYATIPTFVPGKNFEEGMTLVGRVKHTRRVFSNKFTAGKKDKEGNIYRDLHTLTDMKGRDFGIWSVGKLGILAMLPAGSLIAITYLGRDAEALKPGQAPAHNFGFKGENLPSVDWNAEEDDTVSNTTGYKPAVTQQEGTRVVQ